MPPSCDGRVASARPGKRNGLPPPSSAKEGRLSPVPRPCRKGDRLNLANETAAKIHEISPGRFFPVLAVIGTFRGTIHTGFLGTAGSSVVRTCSPQRLQNLT